MTTSDVVQLAAKMYDMRDTLKRLSGDKFYQQVADYSALVKRAAEQWKCSEMSATIRICQKLSEEGHDATVMWMFAGCVELLEPSGPEKDDK